MQDLWFYVFAQTYTQLSLLYWESGSSYAKCTSSTSVHPCSIIAHSPRAYVRTWDKVLCVGTPLQWLQLFSLLHTSKAELCLNNRQNAQANTIIVLPNRPRHGWCEICYVRVRVCVFACTHVCSSLLMGAECACSCPDSNLINTHALCGERCVCLRWIRSRYNGILTPPQPQHISESQTNTNTFTSPVKLCESVRCVFGTHVTVCVCCVCVHFCLAKQFHQTIHHLPLLTKHATTLPLIAWRRCFDKLVYACPGVPGTSAARVRQFHKTEQNAI